MTARVAAHFIVSIAALTSVFSVGLEGAAHASPAAAISEASTFPVNSQVLGGTALSVNPQKIGDLLIFESQIHSQSITVTAVTCPETGAWQLAERYRDTVNGVITEDIWWAVATSTGPTKITAAYSSSIAALSPELVSDSFTSASPSAWSFESGGGAAAANTTAITFPRVTSNASADQLYWAYTESTQTALAGSTPGFTYSPTAEGNLVTSNVALSPNTSYAPTANETPVSNNTSSAAIFTATPLASQYTVTFNGNGSTSGSMANETASVATALTANAFTRTGYTFTGWNTAANGTGIAYANGASYPFTSSTTLYAQWTQGTTLSADGNFATTGNTGITTTNASLAKAGDLLVIWVKSRFTGNPAIKLTNISASGTGAIGTPVNTIQYFTVDHPNNDDEIWYAPITTAGTITLTFTWSGDSSSDFNEYSTQEFQPSTPSTYSTDAATQYENNTTTVTMQFPSLTPVGAGELYAGYNSNNTSGIYTTPTTTGYTANVTADGDAILVDPDVSASMQSPFTTATSQPSTQSSIGALIVATPASQYTVTFNGNGSTSGSMANETASVAMALTANAFTRTGYTFTGWNTAANGTGIAYANGASYPFTSSTTLYAQWTTVPTFTVTFNGNGSTSGSMANETASVATALTANAFTRTGYTFTGWNTAANGTGIAYANGASYPFTSSTTLYAQWKRHRG